MNLFRELDTQEQEDFKQWARDKYNPGDEISSIWHPVVRAECERMNAEQEAS